MIFLQVENLSKSYGDRNLFQNISFGINQGDRVAIVAKNGTGKTTLLRILNNEESADNGKITFRNDISIGFLAQDPIFPKGATVAEACLASNNAMVKAIIKYEGLIDKNYSSNSAEDEAQLQTELQHAMAEMDRMGAWDYEVKIKQILGKLNIHDLTQSVDSLSGGQQKRLALANVLIAEPDILLLDEPTNHLDLEMVEWLEDLLNHSKMTLLMVTHDRYFLDRVCNNIIELDQNQLFRYQGNYSYYLEKQEERINIYNAETSRTHNLYKKELEWMRRQPQARATKAQSRIDAFFEIEQRAKKRLVDKQITLGVKAAYLGSKIFEAQYVSKSFDDVRILDNFYYNFSRYEKLGIIGKNGTGKSTFVKMLMGEVEPDSGRFDIGETVIFAYYSQSGMKFNEGMKVIDAIRNVAEEIDLGGGRKMSASQFLTHFLFPPEKQHDYIEKLSGGERRRLYLCSILIKNPNFLVLDEPTNDLDIATLNVLEDYLINFKGCVIVISHDRFFMDKVVDHLLVFKGNCEIKDFPGNYTDFRDWNSLKLAEEREALEAKKKTENKNQTNRNSENSSITKKKLSYKETKELELLEIDIEKLETEKSEIEAKLSSGNISNDEISSLSNRFSEINDSLDEKTLRWLELEELKASL